MFPRQLLLAASLAALLLSPAPCRADDDRQPVQVTLSPMPASDPPLKYRLWPDFVDRIHGNAAVYYGKVRSSQDSLFSDHELWDKIDHSDTQPLQSLREDDDQLFAKLTFQSPPLYYLRQGALCTNCDWQLPVDREPYFTILLPEMQDSRQFCRLLCAVARNDVAHGRIDEAIIALQTNYALARNAGSSETLVSGLVGLAIAGVGDQQVLTLIQQPEAPNMYWALCELPRPLVDISLAIRAETSSVELMFPDLRNCLSESMTTEQARQLFFKVWRGLVAVLDDAPDEDALAVLASVPAYTAAKTRLVEQGFTTERVESMPAPQVLLADAYLIYRRSSDLCVAAFELPFADSIRLGRQADSAMAQAAPKAPLPTMLRALRPWMEGARIAQVRLERELAVLRLLEALRMHAAANDGRLPETLAEISVVPVPVDPVTDRPFEWSLRDGVAELSGPKLKNHSCQYEIRMRAAP